MSTPRAVPVARPAPRGGMSRPAKPVRLMSHRPTLAARAAAARGCAAPA